MSDQGSDVRATLDAWREQRADRMDPLRFQCIDALARRAAGERGAVRDLLDARLAERIAAYAADLARVPAGASRDDGPATPAARPRDALSTLLDALARRGALRAGATDDVAATLDDVRRVCARARADSQLRQALGHAPENAGPLNSANLVHRALTLMREVSPGYLQAFMAYVDTLASLEAVPSHATRAAAPSRPKRAPRPRRDPATR